MEEKRLVPIQIETLSFDSFPRNPDTDIVCVAPIRTIVRREEEIVLIRRVRKVEEYDASLACPVTTTTTQVADTTPSPGDTGSVPGDSYSGELSVYANVEDEGSLANFVNVSGRPITLRIDAQGMWNYGRPAEYQTAVDANGRPSGPIHNARFKSCSGQEIPPAALVAFKNGLYNPEVVGFGKELTISLQPGEKVFFIINDEPGLYHDNSGNLTLRWSY
jgi:hypothetical protein